MDVLAIPVAVPVDDSLGNTETLRQPHLLGAWVSFTQASSARIFSIEEYARGMN
jgi:hypothetical protein